MFERETVPVKAKLVHVFVGGKQVEVDCMFNIGEKRAYDVNVEQFATEDLGTPLEEEYILLPGGRTYKGHFDLDI